MMKEMFMTKADLVKTLPWSGNVISQMIRSGIFKPVRNPAAAPGRGKMFFWRPQVEESVRALIGMRVEL